MKKCLAFGLAATLAMSTLMACGSSAPAEQAPAAPAAEGEAAAPAAEGEAAAPAEDNGETYKMVMQIINYGFDDPDLGMVQDAVNEITVPEIGVEVQFMTTPIMEQATKLGLLVSGGEQIDLVCAGLLTTPSNLVADGLLQPITEYVNASGLGEIFGDDMGACTINGEVYVIPGSTANGAQNTLYYDADLAEQYGIEVPEKIDDPADWAELFEQVKASGMEQYPISVGDGVACEYQYIDFESFGDQASNAYGVILDKDADAGQIVNLYATPEYAERCKMTRDWFEKGYSVPDSISNGYTTQDSMTQGVIFSFSSAASSGMNKAYWSKITGHNIGEISTGDVMTRSTNVVNFCWGVSSSCERPDKVVDFLKLLYTNTDLANLMNYGIEGVHYTVTEGSRVIGYPEGMDAMSCPYGSFVGTYGDILKTYQREPFTDADIEAMAKYAAPQAKASKYLGYTFDQTPVSTAVTAVTAVVGQYAPSLACGTVDPETTIPEFIAALESAGINDIIAENQAQLDAWLAQQ